MSTQRNKVHHVHTVASVARQLGVDEDLIHTLTLGLEPEDGVIWVYDIDDDDGVLAFTDWPSPTRASTRFGSSSMNTAARCAATIRMVGSDNQDECAGGGRRLGVARP